MLIFLIFLGQLSVRLEQAVKVDDEISHLRIIDSRLGFGLPSRLSGGIIGENSNNVKLCKIVKRHAIKVDQFAPKNEVKQLGVFRRRILVRHGEISTR
jgi:hypothetical protein